MRLLEASAIVAFAAREGGGLDNWYVTDRHVAKQPLREVEHLRRVHLSAGCQDQPRRGKLLLQPLEAIPPRDGAYARLGAQHGPADRLPVERRLEQMIVDEVVGRIDALAKLGQDHLLLALEMVLVEVRRPHEIGDQFGDEREVTGQGTAVKHRLVARCPGIERAAHVLDRLGQCPRVAAAGALEHHVLDEVSEAAELPRFGA